MPTKIKIKNAEIGELLGASSPEFPKYTTQIMNLANSNAQGTRPKVVGQMSDLIQEFPGRNIEDWEKWYIERQPNALKDATDKVYDMIENFKNIIVKIDRAMIEKWINDLIINKTYAGLKFQNAILKKVSELKNDTYKLSTAEEESKSIDGYIGDKPVSVKASTYKSKEVFLSEDIEVEMIYYEKKKDGISIEFNF